MILDNWSFWFDRFFTVIDILSPISKRRGEKKKAKKGRLVTGVASERRLLKANRPVILYRCWNVSLRHLGDEKYGPSRACIGALARRLNAVTHDKLHTCLPYNLRRTAINPWFTLITAPLSVTTRATTIHNRPDSLIYSYWMRASLPCHVPLYRHHRRGIENLRQFHDFTNSLSKREKVYTPIIKIKKIFQERQRSKGRKKFEWTRRERENGGREEGVR